MSLFPDTQTRPVNPPSAGSDSMSTPKAPPPQKKIVWGEFFKKFGLGILIAILLIETFLLFVQWQTSQSISKQQAKAMEAFLKSGQSMEGTHGPTSVALKNVRFCWSPKICVLTDALSAQAIPVNRNRPVNFDDPLSFNVGVEQSSVLIEPSVLEGMFNESVFNYPGSKLRNLTISIADDSEKAGQHLVRLNGSIDLLLWIPFQMDTRMSIDRQTNTLVIDAQTLRVFGFIPVTPFIAIKPFNLDKVLKVPDNQHLTVHRNKIFVKPFGLFPPPRIQGTMDKIIVDKERIRLDFSGNKYNGPASIGSSKNFIMVKGGTTKFSNLSMGPTNILMFDKNPSDPFIFSLPGYKELLPKSDVKMQGDNSIQVSFPDYQWKR